ncbi:hypothetical protein pb186bvf_000348 [Paramecium bursaria]
MASCNQCSKVLQGGWNVTESNEAYKRTGRYLGIPDGYFLYGVLPNWVYCYCQNCWEKQVLALPFVQAAIKAAPEQLQQIIQGQNGQNQFYQNMVSQMSTVVNGQNQTNQLISSFNGTINSNQQTLQSKISEQLKQQLKDIQLLQQQTGNSQQFSNQQINQFSVLIQQLLTPLQQMIQANSVNQFSQSIATQISAVTNAQNQTNQLINSLNDTVNSNEQNIKLKISEQLNLQFQDIQQLFQKNENSLQFSNIQITQLSELFEKILANTYKADQEVFHKEIEYRMNYFSEKIREFLNLAKSQQNSQSLSQNTQCFQGLQSQAADGIIQQQIHHEKHIQENQQEVRICTLIQRLNKYIQESQTICKTYQNDEGKSTNIIKGLWQELETNLFKNISSSLNQFIEHLQQNYNTAVNQVEQIIKARDQFLEYLQTKGVQNYINFEGHLMIFEQDIQKYCQVDLFNLLNNLKELQKSLQN